MTGGRGPAAAGRASRGFARAVFMDRDGVINRESGYITAKEQLHLLPGAASAIRELRDAGFRIVVVTNQSAVARGMLTEAGLLEIHRHLADQLAASGAELDGLYYCPHHPSEGTVAGYRVRCGCRKPAPGLLERAALELGISLPGSYMVGDRDIDIEAGRAAGCQTVFLTGHGVERGAAPSRTDRVCGSLREAAEWILRPSGSS